MGEERSLLSQIGLNVEDPIAFSLAATREGGVKNLVEKLKEMHEKAIKEEESKKISKDDFLSFAQTIEGYMSKYKEILDKDKTYMYSDPEKKAAVEMAIKDIEMSLGVNQNSEEIQLSLVQAYKRAEQNLQERKAYFDDVVAQIKDLKADVTRSPEEKNLIAERLAERYGPSSDMLKEAISYFETKEKELNEYINNLDVTVFKNQLFSLLAVLDKTQADLALYQPSRNSIASLKNKLQLEVGMFGVSLEQGNAGRDFEEFCKKVGISKGEVVDRSEEKTQEPPVNGSQSAQDDQTKENTPVEHQDEPTVTAKELTFDELIAQIKAFNPDADIKVPNKLLDPMYGSRLYYDGDASKLILPEGFYYNEKNGITNKHNTESGNYISVKVEPIQRTDVPVQEQTGTDQTRGDAPVNGDGVERDQQSPTPTSAPEPGTRNAGAATATAEADNVFKKAASKFKSGKKMMVTKIQKAITPRFLTAILIGGGIATTLGTSLVSIPIAISAFSIGGLVGGGLQKLSEKLANIANDRMNRELNVVRDTDAPQERMKGLILSARKLLAKYGEVKAQRKAQRETERAEAVESQPPVEQEIVEDPSLGEALREQLNNGQPTPTQTGGLPTEEEVFRRDADGSIVFADGSKLTSGDEFVQGEESGRGM